MSDRRFKVEQIPLLLRLLFPQRWLRWLVLVGLVLLLCGLLLDGVYALGAAKAFAVPGIVLLILFPLMALPGQLISLVSCRPLYLMTNGRRWLFYCLLIICVLLSLAAYWVLVLCARDDISFLLPIILLVSFSFTCCVWLSSRWSFGREVFFVLYSLGLTQYADQLVEADSLYIGALLVVNWLVFAYWWFQWRPEKYHSNMFFLSPTNAQKLELQQHMNWSLVSGPANSWVGSRLLGAADSWGRRAKEMLSLPLLLSAVLIPLSLLFNQFAEQIKSGASILLLLIASGIGFTVMSNLYRFLPMVWLTSCGGREQLFSLLWKFFWVEVAAGVFTIFALLMLWEFVLGKWSGVSYWLLLLSVVLLFQAMNFFLASWIFLKGNMSVKFHTVITPALTGSWFFCLWATGLVYPLPFGWQGISIHWLWVPELIVFTVLYRPVVSRFSKIELVRPI
jgi:hypothetical protein